MQKILLFAIFLITFIAVSEAQSLDKLLNDKNKNFKEVEYEIHKDHTILDQASSQDRKMYGRWQWFWNSRVDSSGSYEKYHEAMKQTFDQLYPDGVVGNNVTLKSASTLSWTCLGLTSQPSGTDRTIGRGRITSIWVNPGNFNHILVGANSGGLWETTNGGTNWNCLTNTVMLGGVSDIAVDPSNHSIIYITTFLKLQPKAGLGLSGNYSLGVFKSTNGGISWTKLSISVSSGETFERILMNPGNSSALYVLSSKKVYKSTNSGTSWTATSLSITGSNTGFIDMLFKPNDPNTIYVSGRNCIYRTTNGGIIWTDLSSKLNGLFTDSRITIAVNPLNNNDLYAFYCDAAGYATKLEKSGDGGNSWALNYSSSNFYSGRGYTLVLSISPNGEIYAGGIELYKSTNNGQTFSSALNSGSIHVDFTDIIFPDPNDNDLIYVTNDGGVYMDDAGGSSWTNINGNLATNEFYDLDITTQDPEIMLGGTQDCGTYLRSSSGNWEYKLGGDGGTSLIDRSI